MAVMRSPFYERSRETERKEMRIVSLSGLSKSGIQLRTLKHMVTATYNIHSISHLLDSLVECYTRGRNTVA